MIAGEGPLPSIQISTKETKYSKFKALSTFLFEKLYVFALLIKIFE